MDIKPFLYRNITEEIFQLICNKQCDMKKNLKRDVGYSEAVNALIKDKYGLELAVIKKEIDKGK